MSIGTRKRKKRELHIAYDRISVATRGQLKSNIMKYAARISAACEEEGILSVHACEMPNKIRVIEICTLDGEKKISLNVNGINITNIAQIYLLDTSTVTSSSSFCLPFFFPS